jgi:hypothetical protein
MIGSATNGFGWQSFLKEWSWSTLETGGTAAPQRDDVTARP